MTHGAVDWEDFAVFPVYVILAAITFGYLGAEIPYLGWDVNFTVWESSAGYGITLASALAILVLGYVAYTNDWSMNGWSYTQAWVVLVTIILLLTVPLLPVVQDVVFLSDFSRLVAFIVIVGGYAVFSWLG